MEKEEEYRLSLYQPLGALDGMEHVRLRRHSISGVICVEKKVPVSLRSVYAYLQQHPSCYVPKLYECIQINENQLLIIEEYITGRTLEDILREKTFDEAEAAQLSLALCQALKYLHHAAPAIVYRDLKAENIMLDNTGQLKLIDFNIARTWQAGKARDTALLGTAEYAAPEQYGFFQTDNRTDIYAFGVLLNYMLCRKFPAEKMVGGRARVIIEGCTQFDPKDRYQSVEVLEAALMQAYPEILAKGEGKEETDGTSRQEETVPRVFGFTPVGFRSRTPWKMTVATVAYLLWTMLCMQLEITQDGVLIAGWKLYAERALIWSSQLVFLAVVFDYRGWQTCFPVLKHAKRSKKALLYLLAEFLLLFIAAVIAIIIESM